MWLLGCNWCFSFFSGVLSPVSGLFWGHSGRGVGGAGSRAEGLPPTLLVLEVGHRAGASGALRLLHCAGDRLQRMPHPGGRDLIGDLYVGPLQWTCRRKERVNLLSTTLFFIIFFQIKAFSYFMYFFAQFLKNTWLVKIKQTFPHQMKKSRNHC